MEACKGRRTTVLDIESLGNVYKFKTYQLYHSIMWSTLYALVAASLTLLALAPSATQRTAWGLGFEAFATIILTIDVAIYASIVHTRTDPWTCVRFIIVVIFVVDLIRASMLHERFVRYGVFMRPAMLFLRFTSLKMVVVGILYALRHIIKVLVLLVVDLVWFAFIGYVCSLPLPQAHHLQLSHHR